MAQLSQNCVQINKIIPILIFMLSLRCILNFRLRNKINKQYRKHLIVIGRIKRRRRGKVV